MPKFTFSLCVYFSLWVEQDTVIAGKQLYFISSGVANGGKAEANIRYYLAAKDTTRAGIDADTYAMFISHDSIKTMKNNPALFAFKTAEEGGYYLENQKELNENGKPYVGVVNGLPLCRPLRVQHSKYKLLLLRQPTKR